MLRVAVVVLVMAALSGCVTVAPAATDSPTLTPTPTPMPTVPSTPLPTPPATTPSPSPSPSPTVEPTQAPTPTTTLPPSALPTPAGTPDPNATPAPTRLDLAPLLSSEVTVVNLAEQSLSVGVTLLATDSDEEFALGTFELEPLQVTHQAVVPARFRLDFDLAGSDTQSCTIDIGDAEQLQFAVIETGIVMATSGEEPADPEEMVVATASRCQAEAPA